MTKEERDALIASARKTPWLDTMKRRETEALLEALDDAEKRVRELEGAEREADAQRERRKRAEVERDAAHERAETAERERDEARAQLAALHAAASAVQTRARALPVSMTEIVHAEEWDDLDRTIADAAPTAAKHKRRVRAKVIAEVLGLYDGTNGCAAADLTPVIEAAQSLETRIRADERVRALREAAECLREHAASMMQSDLCAGILTAAGMIDARAEVSR